MVYIRNKVGKKHCPKCGGSIFIDNDEYGWFEHCLHCGLTRDLKILPRKK